MNREVVWTLIPYSILPPSLIISHRVSEDVKQKKDVGDLPPVNVVGWGWRSGRVVVVVVVVGSVVLSSSAQPLWHRRSPEMQPHVSGGWCGIRSFLS